MRLSLACALALLLVACRSNAPSTSGAPTDDEGGGAGGSGGAPAGTPLTVLTWNVHNFVNNEFDNDVPNEFRDSNWPTHRDSVAAELDSLNPDIAMLQEVEHLDVLEELNGALSSPYPHMAVAQGNDPYRRIAVLSKVAIDEIVDHKDDSFTKVGTQGPSYKYARDCMEVHVTYGGRSVVLLGVHYKSKENDDADKRLAEAQRTRAIADGITGDSDTITLILGDFNDTPGSSPYDVTIGEEPDVYGNAPDALAEESRWSFNYQGKLELVDQMMASPTLHEMLDASSVTIGQDAISDDTSDHAPVMATYGIF